MSMIIHRCTCGHPDLFHLNARTPNSECSYSWCPSRLHAFDSAPEVIRTWTWDGELVREITIPGQQVHPYQRTCACDECLALYALLTTTSVTQ
jgi:hypothetical protein